jgi:hypothetical protein
MKLLAAAALVSAIVPSLFAQTGTGPQLAIVSGGARIVDRDPSSAASNCSGWSYGPSPVLDDQGHLAEIYTVEDQITNHCDPDLLSPKRFGDTIWHHVRKSDGTWTASNGKAALSRDNLAWMQDPDYLLTHPEAYVGHLGSPAVVKRDGRYFMAFTASVSDPNLCAAEHDDTSACGSCTDPWSYFVVLWATSDDGVQWKVVTRDATASNRALGAAILWRQPPAPSARGTFKGIARISMFPVVDENGQSWFYIAAQYWRPDSAQPPALFRIAYDPSSPSGIRGNPQMQIVFNASIATWIDCPSGEIPPALNDPLQHSLLLDFNQLSTIAPIRSLPPYRYIATLLNGPFGFPGDRPAAHIVYELSTDFVHWTIAQPLLSTITHFADNLSYPSSVIDPTLFEDGSGVLHLLVDSADGDPANGFPRRGTDPCEPSGFGPTAPFVGTGVYEGIVAPVGALTPTSVTAFPVYDPDGVARLLQIKVLAAGAPPNGTATVSPGFESIVSVPIINGAGTIAIYAFNRGHFDIKVSFSTYGLWFPSSVDIGNVTLDQPLPPRRRHSVTH